MEKDDFCDKHICQIILFMESYVPMPAWLLAPDSSLPKPTPLYLVIPTQPQSGHPSSIFNAIWTLAHGVLRQVTVHNRRRFWGGGKGTSKNGYESQFYILFCCWHFIQRFGKCRSLKFDHRISHCYHVNDCSSKTLVIKGGVHFLRHCWPFITDLNFANKRRMAFFFSTKMQTSFY